MTLSYIQNLQLQQIQPLIDSSQEEGYEMIQRLWDEYESGKNRFDANGAELLAVYQDDEMIAIGGVHPDPYLSDPKIGRVRHLYVLPEHRRTGIGRQIMRQLVENSRATFHTLTLRTLTEHGDKFYKSLGFSDEQRYENATHWLKLTDTD